MLEELSKAELINIIKDLQRDKLTGFFRREKINELIKHNYIVAMLDINNLKVVNDKLGHCEGDRLICRVANSIRESIRKSDVVIRYGGDEFVIVFDDCTTIQVEAIVSRIDYVSYGIGENICFAEALKIADDNMYLHKEKLHKVCCN